MVVISITSLKDSVNQDFDLMGVSVDIFFKEKPILDFDLKRRGVDTEKKKRCSWFLEKITLTLN